MVSGLPYKFSTNTLGPNFNVTIAWFNASGAVIGTSGTNFVSTPTVSISGTVPANAVSAIATVGVFDGAGLRTAESLLGHDF